MSVVCFSNQKGGVGKTTSAVNLAASLGRGGSGRTPKKVLLIDLDPQGNTTSAVGINKKSVENTSYELLIGSCTAKEAIISTEFDNLSVIPANLSLAGIELELASVEGREYYFKKAIEGLRGDYDYIIVDCPPSLGIVTINALTASDGVVIPMQCEFFALEGMSQLMLSIRQVKKLYNPQLEIVGILVTMYNARLNLSVQVMDELKKYYPGKLFSTTVQRNVRLSEAPSYGKPIAYYDRLSSGARAYDSLAKEFMSRI